MHRDRRFNLTIGSVAATTALCWLALAVWPAGSLIVCGADGLTSLTPAWDIGHLVSLAAMWAVMSAAMMLPCVPIEMRWRRAPGTHPARDTLLAILALSLIVAPIEWVLESCGAMNNGVPIGGASVQAILILIAATAAVVHLKSQARPASLVAMVALQFAGGAMNLGWLRPYLPAWCSCPCQPVPTGSHRSPSIHYPMRMIL